MKRAHELAALRAAEIAMATERVRMQERRNALARLHARWPFWAALLSTVLFALARIGGGA